MASHQPETIYRIVDNRVLVLGIDQIYRKYMQEFELEFLLPQVEVVAKKLDVNEANVPIEGYYGEHIKLTRYFRLMRALQEVPETSESLVRDLPEFQKIWNVTNSNIFGKPQRNKKLFPQGRDPLSQALDDLKGIGWTAHRIIDRAYEVVNEIDDISLVALAVRLNDPILITALRESVILYAEKVEVGYYQGPEIEYVWKVDNGFAKIANRFIDEFNSLLPEDTYLSNGIPKAESQNAWDFYSAYSFNEILGRCANIGFDRSIHPQYYHWAITQQNNELMLDEFWDTNLWTTDNYRIKQEQLGWKFLKDELKK